MPESYRTSDFRRARCFLCEFVALVLQSNLCSTIVEPMAQGAPPDPALVVTDSMITIDHQFSELPVETSLQLIEFCRRRLDASEARILADRYEAGANDRDVENSLRKDGQTSKAEAKRRAKLAKATNANPDIATRLENGSLSTEQADIIAGAAEETDGEAACDEELIDDVASTTPEQAKKKVRKYVNKRRSADDVQKRFDKQNRQRGVYRHRLENGNDAITIHGPTEYINEIEGAIKGQSNQEYADDGGRDVPRNKHRRTHDQRNFDAARKLFTNSTDDKPAAAGSKKWRHVTVFVTATTDQISGVDPSPFTTLDGKPLPDSFVDEIAGDAAFIAQLFSADGELLWQGRQVRLATPAQINGLTSRDRGCVECGAHPSKCVAHHRLPYEAPVKGETNICDMVLLCTDCHVRLHRSKRTMFYDISSQSWKTRPATPDEIPPDYRGNRKPDAPPGKYRAKRNAPPRKRASSKPNSAERQRMPSLGPPPGRLFDEAS